MTELKMMDFFAKWCGPCRTLSPTIDSLKEEYENSGITNLKILKIDVDQETDLAQKYNIRSIPTIIFERDGEVLERVQGIQSKESLKSKIQNYLEQ